MKLKISEHQIQTQIINYLKYKGWFTMRLNSGKYSVGEGKSKRFIMGQDAGTPDIMAFRNKGVGTNNIKKLCELVFIEVKVLGNKPTALQMAKMKELEEHGAKCLVIHSIEELQAEGF